MKSKQHYLLLSIGLLLSCIQTSIAESAKINVTLSQNSVPSATLFSSTIAVKLDQITITSSGFSEPLTDTSREATHSEVPKFKSNVIKISDPEFAKDLITITKNFELCDPGALMTFNNEGTIAKIDCRAGNNGSLKSAFYIMLDESKRKANTVETLANKLQEMVIANALKNTEEENQTLVTLKKHTNHLASNIISYRSAFSLLEDAYTNKTPVDWNKIDTLINLRTNPGPLTSQKRLVKEAHAILSSFCSKITLQQTLGSKVYIVDGVLLSIGSIRRCQGEFTKTEDNIDHIEWGFDDESTCLGFNYPPSNPVAPIGILDTGLERLLIHFLLQELNKPSTTHDRFRLALKEQQWLVIHNPYSWEKEAIPENTQNRLEFLSKSNLLSHLFNGNAPTTPTYIKVDRIYIENDQWESSRMDYSIGTKSWVNPFFFNQNKWQTYKSWIGRSYFDLGEYNETVEYFRSKENIIESQQ